MAYRGNSALPAEIQQRIESTFQQALTSAKAGSHREALLGCDFILKLDPDFEPARILAQRLRQAAGGEQGMAAEDLAKQLQAHFDQGQYQQVLELAGKHQQLVTGNQQLRQLATQAQERLGMQQFLEKALAGAQQALETGDLGKAEELLKKARSLSPEDPRLAQLEQKIEAQRPAPPAFEAPPPLPSSPPVPEQASPAAQSPSSQLEVPADPLADLTGDGGEWGIFEGAIEPPPAEEQGSAFAAGPPAEAEASAPDFSFGGEPDPLAAFGSDAPASPPPSEEPQDAGFGSLFGDDTSGADSELDAAFEGLGSGELSTVGDAGGTSAEPAEAMDFSFDEASDSELEDDLDFAIGELGGAAPPAPSAAAAPAGSGSSGGGDRISGLLDEGQTAFEAGDYQSAIDVWSRIFLIDIDNEEASRRIEKARNLKAETERQIEEILHEGLAAYEAGDLERARGPFQKVLELNPNHAVAQEYLERVEAGEGPAVAVPEAFDAPPPIPDMPATPDTGGAAEDSVLSQEIMVPPDPDAVEPPPPPPPPAPAKKRKSSPRTLFLAISALSVLLLAALGWFLLNNWSRFFPNQGAETAATAPAGQSPIDQARKLADGGRTRLAISQLERIPSNSPYYEEAQKLILDLQAPVADEPAEAVASAEIGDEGSPRGELVGQARLALEAGRALEARRLLQQAAALAPLSEAEEALSAEVTTALEPIATEVQLFEDSEWGLALPALWRMHVDDPQNQDVVRLLVDSYYNLGVRYLQRNDPRQASESFAEVLELDPDDFEAQRHARFAQVYQERPPDLLYRIYVKYLPFR
ncbi:MAG: tetratricopeptide repeat protein [Acidobacteriota bacterium]|nr:tetratricopeptide repeat protein [Acidobacteriota bacterium]